MLYLLFGKDTFRSRERLRELYGSFVAREKSPLSGTWFSPDTFSEELFKNFVYSKSFFGSGAVVVLDGLLKEQALNSPSLENLIQGCALSENIFIFWEEEVPGDLSEIFEKQKAKIEEFKPLQKNRLASWLYENSKKYEIKLSAALSDELLAKHGSNLWSLSQELEKISLGKEASRAYLKENVNLFQLTDALGVKNFKTAFVLYHRALLNGVGPEEIFWKLVWHAKNLLLTRNCAVPVSNYNNVAKLTGLHPYVAKKCLSMNRFFSDLELQSYSRALVNLWHESKTRKKDLALGIERLLLVPN